VHILLPIKNLSFAKQRLAKLLTPIERKELAQAMLKDVLEVLQSHNLVSGVTLLSDDTTAQWIAKNYQCNSLSQTSLNSHGLSDSVYAGSKHLCRLGIKDLMVIHGDVPLISAAEIDRLIIEYQNADHATVILTPDRRGTGTNCIICSTEFDFGFHYGENSLEKHCAQALLLGSKPQRSEQAGISCDIDYPHDLLHFITRLSANTAPFTQYFLRNQKILERLSQANHNHLLIDNTMTANVMPFAL